MAYFLVFLASLVLYAKSSYAPWAKAPLGLRLQRNAWLVRGFGYALALLSLVLLVQQDGSYTGGVLWLVALMSGLSSVALIVPGVQLIKDSI